MPKSCKVIYEKSSSQRESVNNLEDEASDSISVKKEKI